MDGKKKLKLLLRNLFERLLWRLRADELKAIADRKFLPKNIRLAFLEMVLKKEPVEGRRQLEYTNIPRIPRKMLSEIHPSRCHFSVFGMEMYKKLSESKITFNCHADQAIGEVGNMRMFDATGVGACLLTDTGGNIRDLFEPDKEIVTYTSIEECVEKVNYLLNHENERKQIAAAGQKRTLKDHTVFNRCQQINEVIQKILKEENKGHL